ncbi:hypothetical protein Val02_08220 [Virgisporangium aliadipatigenens]|uniref:Mycothiol-dependent maleylpyruvate isomerase metal-binding domain-containing protein n=1 Tax=Virgisporangium aliadipatigenens TaxID=741659 RepID=A0A8J3YF91_9ACTN|nr:maleylpyruvate isomerase N-terminal domain-containing protein [Virgisporangium aliadipatigenens]GIJ43936.1 hypothetical protein Val02_08220 [Virgisporangium aliadipatigenens]
MEPDRYLTHLAADVALIRALAAEVDGRAVQVPTCPEWTLDDLVRHVAHAYLNVASRRLRLPQDVPPEDLSAEDPIAALDRGHAELLRRLKGGDPAESCGGQPDTVGFWIRRMAHETAMHRIDGVRVGPAGGGTPDAVVHGVPDPLLRRLWNRGFAGEVTARGDGALLDRLGGLLTAVTRVG